MKAGRKPTPAALLKLKGTENVTRARERGPEPEAPGDLLADPPDWLTDGQAASWRYAVEHAPRGILRLIDRGLLTVWCEAEDRHRRATEAQAMLDKRSPRMPFMMIRRKPAPKAKKEGEAAPPAEAPELSVSPYLGVINQAAQVMVRAASEMGFAPAARPRLAETNPGAAMPNDSPWHKLRVLQGGRESA
jgi:phage terminase small subunit